jgi:hypothetical protein
LPTIPESDELENEALDRHAEAQATIGTFRSNTPNDYYTDNDKKDSSNSSDSSSESDLTTDSEDSIESEKTDKSNERVLKKSHTLDKNSTSRQVAAPVKPVKGKATWKVQPKKQQAKKEIEDSDSDGPDPTMCGKLKMPSVPVTYELISFC